MTTVLQLLGSLPVDPLVILAFVLLLAGVVFSIVPLLPGPVLSLAGVALYWWATGDPGWLLLGIVLVVGVLAVLVDWFGGAAAAKASGVSTRISLLAGVIGLVGTVLAGPVGLLVGIAGTVFLVTYYRERDASASLRTAAFATIGVLGTAVVQTLLTGSILVAIVLVHLL